MDKPDDQEDWNSYGEGYWEAIAERTETFRASDHYPTSNIEDDFFVRLRELLKEKGFDPDRTALLKHISECGVGDYYQTEYMVILSEEGRFYDLSYGFPNHINRDLPGEIMDLCDVTDDETFPEKRLFKHALQFQERDKKTWKT